MSDDYLKDPLSLFSVKGKTAIVTGASGAFGAMAAKVLAGAGANVVISAGGAEALKKVAAECAALGGKVESVALRPSSEANCDKIVDAAVKAFGRVDILVVASGINKVSKIVDQKADDFLDVRGRSEHRMEAAVADFPFEILDEQRVGVDHHQLAAAR